MSTNVKINPWQEPLISMGTQTRIVSKDLSATHISTAPGAKQPAVAHARPGSFARNTTTLRSAHTVNKGASFAQFATAQQQQQASEQTGMNQRVSYLGRMKNKAAQLQDAQKK
jgi:hypothetical protein